MKLCPNLKFVLLERLPQSFNNDNDAKTFRDDYARMRAAVRNA
jgi:hypothetical protein